MIRYAVMTFMYAGWVNSEAGSHAELIRILSDAGADGIEAFVNHFFGKDELIELYRDRMADANLTMPVMDLIANLASADPALRDEAYETMRRGIDVCAAFDCEIVHLAGCKLADGQAPEDGRKRIVEGIMDFVDDVDGRGMVLAFEDFVPSPRLICASADCLDIFERTDDRVKFVFDTGNFEAAGERAEDVFDLLFEHSCHFHFKDFAHPEPGEAPTVCRGTQFGQGRTNNADVIRKLKGKGYSGWVALESYPQNGRGPETVIPAELAALKKLFADA